jgi:hypothetical protein
MSSGSSTSLLRRWLLASLTLVSCCVLETSAARASCSHPGGTVERAWATTMANTLAILDVATLDPVEDRADTPWAPRRGQPCSGPNCSERPVPDQAPFRPGTLQTDNWCVLSPMESQRSTGTERLDHQDLAILPSQIPPSIDRPPRGR